MVALPFRMLNQVIETASNIWNAVIGLRGESDGDEDEEVGGIPEYPEPVEVKGFHTNNNEEKA